MFRNSVPKYTKEVENYGGECKNRIKGGRRGFTLIATVLIQFLCGLYSLLKQYAALHTYVNYQCTKDFLL
jgi:hypothetical protein